MSVEIGLVLLRHKFPRCVFSCDRVMQQGHRDKVPTIETIRYRRMVAIEIGMWRSGRKGGASGFVTCGNGRLREDLGGTRL